jgi:hypothetical protein
MSPNEPHAAPPVATLRRPPVRQSTVIRSELTHTFAAFVRTIDRWWPLASYSRGQDRARTVILEQRVGGRFYEVWDDGTEIDWGQVVSWDPPTGFTTTWLVTGAPTEVEFTFRALAPSLTRVSVEHRGWEALSEDELVAACALPGGYAGGAFDRGWAHILGCLAASQETRQQL